MTIIDDDAIAPRSETVLGDEEQAVKILVVDDALLYRRILSEVASEHPFGKVIGAAVNGEDALRKMQVEVPDLVLLDVEMPKMDGLETLRQIRKLYPDVTVVMVSGISQNAAEITVQALNEGALDFVSKPKTSSAEESRAELLRPIHGMIRLTRTRRFLRSARRVARGGRSSIQPPDEIEQMASGAVQVIEHGATESQAAQEAPVPRQPEGRPLESSMEKPLRAGVQKKRPPRDFNLVAIGVSTGGPYALNRLIPNLSSRIAAPIFIVQHMPEGFTSSLASQLNRNSDLIVKEAEDGDQALPGVVYIAPGGRHMVVRQRAGQLVVGINQHPPVRSCRPSVDVLLRSIAGVRDVSALTVIMTGMGEDGSDGVQGLARYSHYTIVQDEKSCVVYGMPRAVLERGLANEIVGIDKMAGRMNELLLRSDRNRGAP